jgi:hypothetical protein
MTTFALDYVLPLRWENDRDLDDLTEYLSRLTRWVRIVIVDDSPAPLFASHARAWRGLALHIRPDAAANRANGKVNGVVTGVRRTHARHLIIADDDVRYDERGLRAVDRLLGEADLVRPQNYFEPAPWHARWDTARTLLNRAFGADYPGTLGIRRATFAAMGGYDGDVLFENLELIRTVHAHGGTEHRPLGLYVRRRPPDTRRFWSQRIRQAYDDTAQPVRMAVFLTVLPGLTAAVVRRRPAVVALAAGAVIGLAEIGRRRAGGTEVFPATAALLAPVWVLERGTCSWLALGTRFSRGGIGYAGRRIRVAAHSVRHLSRRAPAHQAGTSGARKPTTLCEPSQNGFTPERPQRHSATVARPASIRRPS